MAHLTQLLAAGARQLGLITVALGIARRRVKSFRRRGRNANRVKRQAMEKADHLRAEGRTVRAAFQDRKAARAKRRAVKRHDKAQFWIGRVKYLVRQKHQIEQHQDHLRHELHDWLAKHGVVIKGNKAVGGNAHKRWIAVCLKAVSNCSHGIRRNFYSMYGGGFDYQHEIVPGPQYGQRSDCSLSVTGWAWSSDLPSPNGVWPGYTGTMVQGHNGWHQVSEHEMRKRGWGYIVYGSGNGHHVEAFCPSPGSPDRTAGHGTAEVDFGVVNLFGDGNYRCFVHD